MAARDDEDVDWGLGVKVGEGVAKLILVNRGGGDGSFNDLAEQAAHSESSVHGASGHGDEMSGNERGSLSNWFHFESWMLCDAKAESMLIPN